MKKNITALFVGLLALSGCQSNNFTNRKANPTYEYPEYSVSIENASPEFDTFFQALPAKSSVFHAIANMVLTKLNTSISNTIANTDFAENDLNTIKSILNISNYEFEKSTNSLYVKLVLVELLDYDLKANININSNDTLTDIGSWIEKYETYKDSEFTDSKLTFLAKNKKAIDEQFYKPTIALVNTLNTLNPVFTVSQVKILEGTSYVAVTGTSIANLMNDFHQLNHFNTSKTDFADYVFAGATKNERSNRFFTDISAELFPLIEANQVIKQANPNFFLSNIGSFGLTFDDLSIVSNSEGVYFVLHFTLTYVGNRAPFSFDIVFNSTRNEIYSAFETLSIQMDAVVNSFTNTLQLDAKKVALANFYVQLQSIVNALFKYEDIDGIAETEYSETYNEMVLYTPMWFMLFQSSSDAATAAVATGFNAGIEAFLTIPATDAKYAMLASTVLEKLLLDFIPTMGASIFPYNLGLPEAFRQNFNRFTYSATTYGTYRFYGYNLKQLVVEYSIGTSKVYVRQAEDALFGQWWYFNVEPSAMSFAKQTVGNVITAYKSADNAGKEAIEDVIFEFFLNGLITIPLGLVQDKTISMTDASGVELDNDAINTILAANPVN